MINSARFILTEVQELQNKARIVHTCSATAFLVDLWHD